MSDALLVTEVLSLQGDDIVGSSSLERVVQALDLRVPQLHLKKKGGKRTTSSPQDAAQHRGASREPISYLRVQVFDTFLSVFQVQSDLYDVFLQLVDPTRATWRQCREPREQSADLIGKQTFHQPAGEGQPRMDRRAASQDTPS